jgi:hypothetical protein
LARLKIPREQSLAGSSPALGIFLQIRYSKNQGAVGEVVRYLKGEIGLPSSSDREIDVFGGNGFQELLVEFLDLLQPPDLIPQQLNLKRQLLVG